MELRIGLGIVTTIVSAGLAWSARAAVGRPARRPPPSFASRLIPYPGLNQAERDLVAKKPRAAIVVFIQKERAERASHS